MLSIDLFIGFALGVATRILPSFKRSRDKSVQADEVWNVTVSEPISIYK
jgi:hypothetical protein